jgi:hypothetical protein
VGGKAQPVGGIGAPVLGHTSDVLATTQGVVDNPVTADIAGSLGGHEASKGVHEAGAAIGGARESTEATTTTLDHPAEFGRSVTGGGFEALHAVASVVGIFFSALKAALDFRSLVSSIRVYRALKQARAQARVLGTTPTLVEAVEYAIKQKYEKIFKRAFGTAVALAALGTGLAILIANPVGASLAALIIGGIGASMFVYKVGRWAWKKWATQTLGEKRQKMASRLYNQMLTNDVMALEAVRSLHLDPVEVRQAGDTKGPALIFRKLRSA